MEKSKTHIILTIWLCVLTIIVIVDLGYQFQEEDEEINNSPIADIWASIGSGLENEDSYTSSYKIWLDAGHSYDPDGQPLIFNWDFNLKDDISIESTSRRPTIIFYDLEQFQTSWKVPNPMTHVDGSDLYRYYVPIGTTIEIKLTVSDGSLTNNESIYVTIPEISHPDSP